MSSLIVFLRVLEEIESSFSKREREREESKVELVLESNQSEKSSIIDQKEKKICGEIFVLISILQYRLQTSIYRD